MKESQRNNFITHVIKDVFDPQSPVMVYGGDFELVNTLRTPEFSNESWGLTPDQYLTFPGAQPYVWYWKIPYNDTHFGRDYTDLFVSIECEWNPDADLLDGIALRIMLLLKNGGHALIIDPGTWDGSLEKVFARDSQLEREVMRYSMFAGHDVAVYRK